ADRPGTGSPRSYLPRAWANDRAPPRTSSCSPSNRRQRRSARKFCGAAAACHMCDVRSGRGASGAAAPEPAIAACDELQAVLIAGPACVFLKLERLLALVPTFAGEPHRLHLGRGGLQQFELVLGVLLGAEPAVGRPRMARNEALPVHRQNDLDELLGVQRTE